MKKFNFFLLKNNFFIGLQRFLKVPQGGAWYPRHDEPSSALFSALLNVVKRCDKLGHNKQLFYFFFRHPRKKHKQMLATVFQCFIFAKKILIRYNHENNIIHSSRNYIKKSDIKARKVDRSKHWLFI